MAGGGFGETSSLDDGACEFRTQGDEVLNRRMLPWPQAALSDTLFGKLPQSSQFVWRAESASAIL